MGANPNFYSNSFQLGATTSADADGFFDADTNQPFEATFVRILNTQAVDLFVDFGTTVRNNATTADFRVRACSDTGVVAIPRCSGIAVKTTSTAGGLGFDVAAFGG